MKQTIEIEVPDGKKAVWKYNKIIFEDIKPQLPKTWEEFCKQNMMKKGEYYLDSSSCATEMGCGERCECTDKDILPNKQAAEAHLALMQLHQLRDCYRQGWIPNWIDGMNNWYIYNNKNCPVVTADWYHSRFLSFQSKEIAQEFLTNFRELIEQAGDLI